MTPSGWLLALCAVAAGALCILQLWYPLFTTAVFVKLLVTLAVIAGVTGIVAIARRESLARKRDYLE